MKYTSNTQQEVTDNELKELREENERLRRELELEQLRAENKSLKEQIWNHKYWPIRFGWTCLTYSSEGSTYFNC